MASLYRQLSNCWLCRAPSHVHSCVQKVRGSKFEMNILGSGIYLFGVGRMWSSHHSMGDHYRRLQSWSARPYDGHVWLMQPVAHTAACGSLAVSAGILEITGLLKALEKWWLLASTHSSESVIIVVSTFKTANIFISIPCDRIFILFSRSCKTVFMTYAE